MKKPRVALLSLLACSAIGLALVAIYSSCGSTGGGVSDASLIGQFVSPSCGQGGNACLQLSVPGLVSADGVSVTGFRASLVDGSGVPLSGVSICFRFDNPDVAIILEPTNSCGLTDSNGRVRGQFRNGIRDGSFQLIATVSAGFNLEVRRTVKFIPVGEPLGPGNVGQPCQTGNQASVCNNNLFCSFQDDCFPGGSVCTEKQTTGPCCTSDIECVLGSCDVGTAQCVGQGEGQNAPCVNDANCNTGGGLFCTFSDTCFPGQRTCQPKSVTASCCTNGLECASASCDVTQQKCLPKSGTGNVNDPCSQGTDCKTGLVCVSSTCQLPSKVGGPCNQTSDCATGLVCTTAGTCKQLGTAGDPCASNADCNANLFCTFINGDGGFPANKCEAKFKNGAVCSNNTECQSSICDPTLQKCATTACGVAGTKCTVASQCCNSCVPDPAPATTSSCN